MPKRKVLPRRQTKKYLRERPVPGEPFSTDSLGQYWLLFTSWLRSAEGSLINGVHVAKVKLSVGMYWQVSITCLLAFLIGSLAILTVFRGAFATPTPQADLAMAVFPWAAAIPAFAGLISSVGSQIFGARSQRKEYDRMVKYNAPKAQMARFQEAGLSPYLMYGQGSSGNVSTPRPPEVLPDKMGESIGEYMAMSNFDIDLKNKGAQFTLANQEMRKRYFENSSAELTRDKQELELISDYPQYLDDLSRKDIAGGGYRRKLMELKRAASQAVVDKASQSIQNLKYKNAVDSVRARYAKDYGMVGGDWTQGMGLLKSIPNMFKKSRVTVPPAKAGTPPWRGSLQVNPVKRVRTGGFKKGGYTRP